MPPGCVQKGGVHTAGCTTWELGWDPPGKNLILDWTSSCEHVVDIIMASNTDNMMYIMYYAIYLPKKQILLNFNDILRYYYFLV